MKNSLIICLATATALFALISSAKAQIARLIGFTDQNWQYYEAGDQPANNNSVDWKAPTYDDTEWKMGRGFFAHELDTPSVYNPINTSLTWSNVGASEIIRTYYFRTHFNFSGVVTNTFLHFTNVVDDGCVVYLNGSELYRLHMASGLVTYSTLANGTPAVEGANELVSIFNAPALRQGDNVLTVEVHQNSTSSSDVAWNLGLAFSKPEPLVISKQPPADLDVVEFDDPVLSVDVMGTDPRYWWFRNDLFLAGQTNRTLVLNNILVNQAGTYYVVVSNGVSTVRSSNTVMRVVRDTFGPRIVDAYVPLGESNRMLIQFNEDINRLPASNPMAGINTNNYFITVLGQTNRLRVALAQVGLGTAQVRLTFDTNINRLLNYQICISNITDVRTNTIAWNSCVPVGYEMVTNPIVYGEIWSYHEWGFPPIGDWKSVDYFEDPAFWIRAPALFAGPFFVGGINPPLCSFKAWDMSPGYCAYYFRGRFLMPSNLAGVNMTAILGHLVSDGAVFHLNGVDVARYNIPAGPVEYCTQASGVINVACLTNAIVNVLLGQTNVLAVELHQSGAAGNENEGPAFDASLSLRYLHYPTSPQPANVPIFITNHSPTEVSVYFTNGFGYAIQSKTNLSDPWREVQPVTNRLVTPKSNPGRFFRLEKGHAL